MPIFTINSIVDGDTFDVQTALEVEWPNRVKSKADRI